MLRRAFTLIELLVVIAIIAILAAILFPVFAQAKMAAKKSNDLSHLKQDVLANIMYLNDNDDVHMAFVYSDSDTVDLGPHWADRLQPYSKSKDIFSDPSNTLKLWSVRGYWLPGASSKTDPDKLKKAYRVTYSLNSMIAHSDGDPVKPRTASNSGIPTPADTVLMGPSLNWFTWPTCRINGTTTDLVWNVSNPTAGWGYEFWGGITANAGYAGGANFGYCDGHALYCKIAPGGDKGGAATSLYSAAFPRAKLKPEATTDGKCPTTYDSENNGF